MKKKNLWTWGCLGIFAFLVIGQVVNGLEAIATESHQEAHPSTFHQTLKLTSLEDQELKAYLAPLLATSLTHYAEGEPVDWESFFQLSLYQLMKESHSHLVALGNHEYKVPYHVLAWQLNHYVRVPELPTQNIEPHQWETTQQVYILKATTLNLPDVNTLTIEQVMKNNLGQYQVLFKWKQEEGSLILTPDLDLNTYQLKQFYLKK